MEATGPQLRALRAALFAALCVTLSVTAHTLLSQLPLPLTTVAGAYFGVFTAAYALGGRERGYWAIASLLVPLELASDALFTSGQHTCYGPGGGPITGSWRSINEAFTCRGGDVGTPLSHAAPDPGTAPWALLAAHITLGLLASWWLRRGEAGVHQLLRTTFRPLLLAVASLGPEALPFRPKRRPAGGNTADPALPLLLHSVVRRGPPCSLAV
jgi:hypothetical protein